MEKALQNRIGYFFIALLIVTLLGFYPTYLIRFPTFKGFTTVHHFHGAVSLLWIILLITLAFLIQVNNHSTVWQHVARWVVSTFF